MNKKEQHNQDLAKALKANLIRRKMNRIQENAADKKDNTTKSAVEAMAAFNAPVLDTKHKQLIK